MKVLLDECIDVELRNHIAGHDVFTVAYMKWKGLKNGDLLVRAEAQRFDAFVTTDRGVPYEQHIAGFSLAVIVLQGATNDIEDLETISIANDPATTRFSPRIKERRRVISKRYGEES